MERAAMRSQLSNYVVSRGDRVAQLVLERIATPEVRDLDDYPPPDTRRGAQGFGSTGS